MTASAYWPEIMLTPRSQPQEEVDLCQNTLTGLTGQVSSAGTQPCPDSETVGLCAGAEAKDWKEICVPLLLPYSREVFIILLPNRLSPMFYSSPFFLLLILTQFQINIFQEITYLIPNPSYPCLWLRNERMHKTSCEGLKIESRFKVLFFCPKAAKALACFNFCSTHCFLLPSLPSSYI